MVHGGERPEHNDYDDIYPDQWHKKQKRTTFWKSALARSLFPNKADFTLKTEVREKYLEPRNRFSEHAT